MSNELGLRNVRCTAIQVFPLEDAAAAYEYGRTGRCRGKIVVQVE